MDGRFQYPVFFECRSLDREQRRKIENYFHVRRKSGGGQCSSLTSPDDKVYSIAFMEREAQQRVLEKCTHELEFAGGPLVLTVRGSPLSPDQSLSGNQNISSSQQQEQQSIPGSRLPPSGEEYELQPDVYLLRYLKDCPKAGAELEKELASVACSAQLYPDEGRVLVKRLVQPHGTDKGRNWKAEVDKLFDAYLCHYEVDPHKVQALLQSCSSGQATGEVKVYAEDGLAVVVGKHGQVIARLEDVKRQLSRSAERQTSIRRLGEAKRRLLWDKIVCGLGIDFPGVKVTQGDAGQVVLEGSAEDILEAGNWISDKSNLVLERSVSNKSPRLLAFFRKAYGSPRMLLDFLRVCDEVEIELGDTELCFFSLSADKLEVAEKALQSEFTEVKIDVPNCTAVPAELQEKLKSKTSELNQGQYKAQVLFGSVSQVCILGRTKEVEELNEVVVQFILDHACVEGKVTLKFAELSQLLPDLLQLHMFDHSGVTFRPLTSSSGPTVLLEGPSNKVTEVRNRLGPFLDSLVQGSITINMPGAVRYLGSPSGRENMLGVARSQKCLILPQEQSHNAGQNFGNGGRHTLCDGLQVLVCQGDITKQDADALVNAANEYLDHGGGVAGALSKAGGPEIQKESKALIKQIGRVPTGDVVVTTGGKLKCKKLLHAVGPSAGRAGGRERFLLEKTVQSALNMAETMEFKSIAMPCISSGIFGVPLPVCAEAIVTAVKRFGSQEGRSLRKIILISNRGEVVRAMQEACVRLLQGTSSGNTTPSDEFGSLMGAAAQDTARGDGVHVEVVQGTIENQQVEVLVCPMAGHDPLSSRVGHVLSGVVGPQLANKFHRNAGGATLPGDVVLVDSLPALQSKAVIFLNLLPWDNIQNGTAVQALRQGIKKLLASCGIRGLTSVALPVLGTGAVLRFPHSVASRVLLEEVRAFEQSRMSTSPFRVRIVIHPQDKESSKAFQSAQEALHLRGFTNDADLGQASFYSHVSLTANGITSMLGTVKLEMVHGDIVNEVTDIIVSTTDFSNNQSGVSKAILTAAGPIVQAELARVGLPADLMCFTGPGSLGCKEIFHASFRADPQLIQKHCKKIVKHCESKGYGSVALPAINTGAAGMDPVTACKAILDGMALAIKNLKPNSLALIRILIMKQSVFQAFRSELENRSGQPAPVRLNLRERAKQKLKRWQEKYSKSSASSTRQERSIVSSKPRPAVLSVICCGQDIITTVKRDLESILQKQLVDRTVNMHDFSRLKDTELEAVLEKVRVLGISVEEKSGSVDGDRAGNAARAQAKDRSGSGKDVYVLRGLKEDVLTVTELVNTAVHEMLCKDLQDKEEAMLALKVQWSIKDVSGTWHELSLPDNYALENAHMMKKVSEDVTAPDGLTVKVNLKTLEGTNWKTGRTYKVKRSEGAASLELPKHWEPMSEEVFKKVQLQASSQEYQDVAQGFLKTARYNIQKIERIQNVYLWHAYTVCRERILVKNGQAELGERSLYHGTSAESCKCIERDRFDRSYAGKHAALYGKGVYFAVDAAYSADRYSPADASGLKRLYVARVVTGRYTVGQSAWNAPPPRATDPTDCFDSVVNNQQQPTMFVIFHDDQAYPEYLITFK